MSDLHYSLARIEQRIVEGEGRIARLLALISRLALCNRDATRTKELLQTFEDVLLGWNRQRQFMLSEWHQATD